MDCRWAPTQIVNHLENARDTPSLLQPLVQKHLDFGRFANILRRSEEPTLDEFMADAPVPMRTACLLATAFTLLSRERASQGNKPYSEDWMAAFVQQLARAGPADAAGVGVITFNYDRLLEYRLLAATASRLMKRDEEIEEKDVRLPIEVLHVWGCLEPALSCGDQVGPDFERLPITPETVERAARGIRTMGDPLNIDVQEKIQLWANRAARVIFLGFGFHDSNLLALGLNEGWPSARCYSTCVKLDEERMRQLDQATHGYGFGFVPDRSCLALLHEVPNLFDAHEAGQAMQDQQNALNKRYQAATGDDEDVHEDRHW